VPTKERKTKSVPKVAEPAPVPIPIKQKAAVVNKKGSVK
jgi:hypothetical protein